MEFIERKYYQIWWLPDSPYGRLQPCNNTLYNDSSVPFALIEDQPYTLFPNRCVCEIIVKPLNK